MSDTYGQKISGPELEKALGITFAILGNAGSAALLRNLGKWGIHYEPDKIYELEEIDSIIEEIFGNASGPLMHRLHQALSHPH